MHAGIVRIALVLALLMPGSAFARKADHIERVVLIYRHGVRAPLSDENGLAAIAPAPMPAWTTAESNLTPHGARAVTLLGAYQRQEWLRSGLLPTGRCPRPQDLVIWTNTVSRTIATGQALAEGVAPGCNVPIGHLSPDQHDRIFEQMESGQDPFDARRAAADTIAYTGGMAAMDHRLRPALAAMAQIIGRDLPPGPGTIAPSADGRGVAVDGPVIAASGTAQIFLLQYMEGLPLAQVGWGHADPAAIAAVSPLHAALFDALDRSPYIAPRVAGVLAQRMLTALFATDQTRVTLLVGHDNNIAALGALLDTRFRLTGLGWNDPPPGGALGLELVRGKDGRRRVRAFYIAATPDQVRDLTVLDDGHRPTELSLTIGLCGKAARDCPADLLRRRLLARATDIH
jgi:4-phytase/acid phosphatase